MAKGHFITFEGGEGSGKSTQVERLKARLESRGLAVTATREPGGSPGAEQIRELLIHGDAGRWDALSEALLNFAARRDHLRRTIVPALGQGHWVLSDRFADSTRVYQGYGQGLSLDAIDRLYDLVVGDQGPEVTIILDLPVEVGLARAAERRDGGERFENMDLEFHERLRMGFREIADKNADRCHMVDASAEPSHVEQTIWRLVEQRWPEIKP